MEQIFLSSSLPQSLTMPSWHQTNPLLLTMVNNKVNISSNRSIKTAKLVGARCMLKSSYSSDHMHGGDTILHMNGAETDFSYANHSLSQKNVILETRPVLEETIKELYNNNSLEYCINIADLGCSSGPNTFLPARHIIEVLDTHCKSLNCKPPALQCFLNDLPGNDYNAIFRSLLPKFLQGLESSSCFVAGVPGSFYGRLFPSRSLHFIYASHSLHFLSQVPAGLVSERGIPLNKKSIYISKSSPPVVHKAYSEQFKKDFTQLLKLRSEEMVHGGRMVFTIACRQIDDYKFGPSIWEPMGMALADMVYEGLIEESKLDTFNIPYYEPYVDELRDLIESEGSFTINRQETFRHSWYANMDDGDTRLVFDNHAKAKYVAHRIRAAGEPVVASHFGGEIIDDLFRRFCHNALGIIELGHGFVNNVVISMTRK